MMNGQVLNFFFTCWSIIFLVLLRISISKQLRTFMWIFTLIIGLYSMYSVTLYYVPTYEYTRLESALYNSLHRLGWSALASWMLIACVTSENGCLKSLLSWRGLVPISRLTYCAYLTNGFVELYMAASVRSPKYMSVTNLVILIDLEYFSLLELTKNLLFSLPIHSWARRYPTFPLHFWQLWFFAWCSSHQSTASKKCCCEGTQRNHVIKQANQTTSMSALEARAPRKFPPKFSN